MNTSRDEIEKMKYLKSGLQSEIDKMYEVLSLLKDGWMGPEVETVEGALRGKIRLLEEQAFELENRLTALEETAEREDEAAQCQNMEDRGPVG